jgi:hypothetical protein
MMCNVSYVVCIYSMLNGVIHSREVRKVKAAARRGAQGLPVGKDQGKAPSRTLGCNKCEKPSVSFLV